MKHVALEYRRNFDIEYDDFLSLTDQCIELGNIAIDNIAGLNLSLEDCRPLHFILAFNQYKATDALISTVKLIDAGLIGDAQTIGRKILEVAVNMKYLAMDVDRRENQYWQYLSISSKKTGEQIISDDRYNQPLRDAIADLQPEAQKRYDESVDIFEKDKKGKPRLSTWSGRNIKEMAEECGLENDYLYCYKLFCIPTHGSIEGIGDYLDVDKMAFGPRYKGEDALALILEASRLYLIVLELVIIGFSLKLMDSHKFIRKNLGSFKGDFRLPNSGKN